jgi:hypothetical protein
MGRSSARRIHPAGSEPAHKTERGPEDKDVFARVLAYRRRDATVACEDLTRHAALFQLLSEHAYQDLLRACRKGEADVVCRFKAERWEQVDTVACLLNGALPAVNAIAEAAWWGAGGIQLEP